MNTDVSLNSVLAVWTQPVFSKVYAMIF